MNSRCARRANHCCPPRRPRRRRTPLRSPAGERAGRRQIERHPNRRSISLQAASEGKWGSSQSFRPRRRRSVLDDHHQRGARLLLRREAAMHVFIFDRLSSEPPGARARCPGEGVSVIGSEDSKCVLLACSSRALAMHRGRSRRMLKDGSSRSDRAPPVELGHGQGGIAAAATRRVLPATGRACWRTTSRRPRRRPRALHLARETFGDTRGRSAAPGRDSTL